MIYNDGRYEGEFKEGKIEGKGIRYFCQDDSKYEGEWKNGIFEGKGIMTSKNGIYDGNWKDGFIEGKGIIISSEGDRLESSDFKHS